MQESKWRWCTFVITGFILFHTACAQNQPISGLAYVNEEKLAEQATVLLNNAAYVIPLQNLDELKIASVHFTSPYNLVFDSLLNKYSKITSFNGNDYTGVKNLDMLSTDLKYFNTIILQFTDADLNNPQLIAFINSNQKIKTVIISLIGNSTSLEKLGSLSAPLIWCAHASPVSAAFEAQAIFGGMAITQKLKKNRVRRI